MVTNIGDIRRKLDACIAGRNATDAAVRVYQDAKILVNDALDALTTAEQVLTDAAAAAEAALDTKVAAVVALETGMEGLLDSIQNAKRLKKGNALDTCIAIREAINDTAQTVDRLKRQAESAAELSSIADAAVQTAESAWLERVRVYDNAVATVESARNAAIEAAKILGV